MARYLIPAFEVETIEDLRAGNSGETWLGCGMVSYMTENNEIVRSKLNFLGGN